MSLKDTTYTYLKSFVNPDTEVLNIIFPNSSAIPWQAFFDALNLKVFELSNTVITVDQNENIILKGSWQYANLLFNSVEIKISTTQQKLGFTIIANTKAISANWIEAQGLGTIPPILNHLKNYPASNGTLSYNSNQGFFKCQLDASTSTQELISLSNFKLTKPFIQFTTNKKGVNLLTLLAAIQLFDNEQAVSLNVPLNANQKWELQLLESTNTDIDCSKLITQLEAYTGTNINALIPTFIKDKLPKIGLHYFELFIPYDLKNPANFNFVIGSYDGFPIYKNIKIEFPTLTLNGSVFYNKLHVQAQLEGSVYLDNGSSLKLVANINSDINEPLEFSLRGNINLQSLNDLNCDLLGFKLQDLHLPAHFLQLTEINITKMDIGLDLKKLKLSYVELELDATCDIELIKGIKLGNPSFALNYDGEEETISKALTGNFEARLQIGQTSFYGSATKFKNGWKLEARTGITEPILLKTFIKDVAQIGGLTIDTNLLPNLKINYTSFLYNTQTTSFSFTSNTETTFELPFLSNPKATISSYIDLHATKKNDAYIFNWNLGAEFEVSHSIFSVKFEKKDEGKRIFKAGWKITKDGEPLSLKSITKAVGIDCSFESLPTFLNPQLNEVAFSYNEATQTIAFAAYTTNKTTVYFVAKKDATKKWQFAMGLNYTAAQLPESGETEAELFKVAKAASLEQLSLMYANFDLENFELPTAPTLPSNKNANTAVSGKTINIKAGLFFVAEAKNIVLPELGQFKPTLQHAYIDISKTKEGVKALVKGTVKLELETDQAPLTISLKAAYSSLQTEFEFEGEINSSTGVLPFVKAIAGNAVTIPADIQFPDIKQLQLKLNTKEKTASFLLTALEGKEYLVLPNFLKVGASQLEFTKQKNEYALTIKKSKLQLDVLNDFFATGVGGNLSLVISDTRSYFNFEADGFTFTTPAIEYTSVESMNDKAESIQVKKKIEATLQLGVLSIEKNKSQWTAKASANFWVSGMPSPANQLFEKEENGIWNPKKFTGNFAINNSGASASITGTPLVELVIPDILSLIAPDTNLPKFGESAIALKAITCRIGKDLAVEIDAGIALPSNLNAALQLKENIFRTYKKDDLNSYIDFRLSIGTAGISGGVSSSLFVDNEFIQVTKTSIDLDLDKLFKEESFGKISIDIPQMALDLKSGSFKFSGGYRLDKDKGLRLPLFPIHQLLKAMKLEGLAKSLPKSLPVKSLSATQVINDMKETLKKPNINCPKEFLNVLDGLQSNLDKLPKRFVDYLSINIPQSLKASIEVTTDGGISFNIKTEGDPLQVLLPTFPQLIGIRLHGLSFGTAFGGSLLKLEVSAELDVFDIITLASSYLLLDNETLKPWLATRDKIQNTFTAKDFVVLIVYQAGVPIPIPLFYTQLGINYVGVDGSGITTSIAFPKPSFNATKLLKIVSGAKAFIIDKKDFEVEYPITFKESSVESDLNITFHAGPFYLQLPKWLSANEDGSFKKIGIQRSYKLLDVLNTTGVVLNGIKQLVTEGSPAYLIQAFPFEYRHGDIHLKLLDKLALELKWLISTPNELIELGKTKPTFFSNLEESNYLLSLLQRSEQNPFDAKPVSEITGLKPDDKGLVSFMRAQFTIRELVQFKVEGGVLLSGKQFAACLAINGNIANNKLLLSLHGQMLLKKEYLALEGSGRLNVMGIEVFKGHYKFTPQHIELEASVLPNVPNSPFAFHGKLLGQLTQTHLHLEGAIHLKILALTVNGSAKLISNKEEALLELKGDFKLENYFSVNALFITDLKHKEWNSQLTLTANILDIVTLKFNGQTTIQSQAMSLNAEAELYILNTKVISASLTASNDKLSLSGVFNPIAGLYLAGFANLEKDKFELEAMGKIELGLFKSGDAKLITQANQQTQIVQLTLSNLLNTNATAIFNLTKNEKSLRASSSVSQAMYLLNGMLVISDTKNNAAGPNIELILNDTTVEKFYASGAISFLGVRDEGFVHYENKNLNYRFEKRWNVGSVFKGNMTLQGSLTPHSVNTSTSGKMSIDFKEILKAAFGSIADALPSLEVGINIDEISISASGNPLPEERLDGNLRRQQQEALERLQEAKRQAEKQREEIAKKVEETKRIINEAIARLQKHKASLQQEAVLKPEILNEHITKMDAVIANLKSQESQTEQILGSFIRVNQSLEQVKAERDKIVKNKQEFAQKGLDIQTSVNNSFGNSTNISVREAIKAALTAGPFNSELLTMVHGHFNQPVGVYNYEVHTYLAHMYNYHFLKGIRGEGDEDFRLVRNNYITCYDRIILLYDNAYKGTNDNYMHLLREEVQVRPSYLAYIQSLETNLKQADGLLLNALADENAVLKGKLSATEIINQNANVETLSEAGRLMLDANANFNLSIVIKVSFKLGSLSFNLVNLQWTSSIAGYDSQKNILEQLPNLLMEYLKNNMRHLIMEAIGSIIRVMKFVWDLIRGTGLMQIENTELVNQEMYEKLCALDGNALLIARDSAEINKVE